MARKIACKPSTLTLGRPAGSANFEATVIPLQFPINVIRKSGPSKYDMKGPNDPLKFLHILTPAYQYFYNQQVRETISPTLTL